MKINFIRHGKTLGNTGKKYIGSTDQPLCEAGISELKKIAYPDCDLIIASPMKRCIRTAEIIYPGKKMIIENDFRECDFGDFENKSHIELSASPYYQEWIVSGGNLPFPNGESPSGCKERCITAFADITAKCNEYNVLSLVVHGGTIMSIIEKYAYPKKTFYEWHCENGHGYVCEYNGKNLSVLEKI